MFLCSDPDGQNAGDEPAEGPAGGAVGRAAADQIPAGQPAGPEGRPELSATGNVPAPGGPVRPGSSSLTGTVSVLLQESSFANRKLLEQLTEEGQEKERLLRELDEAKKVPWNKYKYSSRYIEIHTSLVCELITACWFMTIFIHDADGLSET